MVMPRCGPGSRRAAVMLAAGPLVWFGAGGVASGSEGCRVLDVIAADKVLVVYHELPLPLSLAYLDIPPDQAAAAKEELSSLAKGHEVQLTYSANLGTDEAGNPRVCLSTSAGSINGTLIAHGLSRCKLTTNGSGALDRSMRDAQDSAEKAKRGLWAKSDASGAATQATPPITAAAKPAAKGTGPFCAELDGIYYFASSSPDAEKANQERLIYYPDKGSAERAGKKFKAPVSDLGLPSEHTEASADVIFAKGSDIYAQAIAQGNNSGRDELYAQAFTVLSKAMTIYSELCEKRPDDTRLGEKLHQCMQLRYGAVKNRRFE